MERKCLRCNTVKSRDLKDPCIQKGKTFEKHKYYRYIYSKNTRELYPVLDNAKTKHRERSNLEVKYKELYGKWPLPRELEQAKNWLSERKKGDWYL